MVKNYFNKTILYILILSYGCEQGQQNLKYWKNDNKLFLKMFNMEAPLPVVAGGPYVCKITKENRMMKVKGVSHDEIDDLLSGKLILVVY